MPWDSEQLGEPERLQINLLPLGGAECYLDLRNPEFLKREFSSKDIPTKVTTYRNENLESLKSIQYVASTRLKKMQQLYPSDVDKVFGNMFQYILTGIPDAVISLLSYSAFQNSEPLLGTVGLITVGGITTASGLVWRKRNKNFKEKTERIQTNIKKFEAISPEDIVVKVDKELEEMSGLIEGNLTHHIKPQSVNAPSDGTYIWIKKMFSELGTSIPQYARDIYELKMLSYRQKQLADKGLLRLTDR